jgi:hypothetical protein
MLSCTARSSCALCLLAFTFFALHGPEASARSRSGRGQTWLKRVGQRLTPPTSPIVRETANLGARNARLRTEITLRSRLQAARRENTKLKKKLAYLKASDAEKLLQRVDAVNRDLGYLSQLTRLKKGAGLGGTLKVFEHGAETMRCDAQLGEIRYQKINRVTSRINAVNGTFARLVSEQPRLLTTPIGGELHDRLRQTAGFAREIRLEPKPDHVTHTPRIWTRKAVENFSTAQQWLAGYLKPYAD